MVADEAGDSLCIIGVVSVCVLLGIVGYFWVGAGRREKAFVVSCLRERAITRKHSMSGLIPQHY